MVRSPKGAGGDESPPGRQVPRHAVNPGNFDGLVARERRQNSRQSTREHRFPRSRGAEEKNVVSAGGGNLEGTPGVRVSPDVGEIHIGRARRGHCDIRVFMRLKWLMAAQSA